MAVTQKVTLYNNKFTVPPVINAVQNDTDRQIVATLGDFTLASGMTAKLSFERPDKTHYETTGTVNTTNNTVTTELDQALTQVGICKAQIKVTETDGLGSTFTFIIKVQPDVAGISVPQDGWSAQEFDQRLTDAENAIDAVEEDVADLQDKEYDYAPVITDTASGSIASFPDGADNYPMRSVVADINPVQEGTGDPSPDNIRQISGVSSVNIHIDGKNILPPATFADGHTQAGVTVNKASDGTLTFSNTATEQTWLYINSYNAQGLYNFRFPKGQYILSSGIVGGSSGSYRVQMSVYDASTNAIKRAYEDIGSGVTCTINDNETEAIYIYIPNGKNMSGIVLQPMLRLATDSDATFEGYKGTTKTINLGRTVYGSTVDAINGKLSVSAKYTSITNTRIISNVTILGAYTRFWAYIDADKIFRNADDVICDCLPTVTPDAYSTEAIGIGSASGAGSRNSVFIKLPTSLVGTTVDSIKAYLANNPIHIVYYVNTATEYDLTPTEIKTLLGTNNVWSDTGNTTAEYCADTKRYIQKLISQLA